MTNRLLRLTPPLLLVLTVGQLLVATCAPDLPRFAGKGFGVRLAAYPVLMLVVPAAWWVSRRRAEPPPAVPYGAFALVMAPFLIDVTGNTLNLYDSVSWWDEANHFVNWALLCSGLALLIAVDLPRRSQQVLVVTGLGALLAIGWEVGEWATFVRHGTELAGAYQDTLSDEVLGSTGALAAGLFVAWHTGGASVRLAGTRREGRRLRLR